MDAREQRASKIGRNAANAALSFIYSRNNESVEQGRRVLVVSKMIAGESARACDPKKLPRNATAGSIIAMEKFDELVEEHAACSMMRALWWTARVIWTRKADEAMRRAFTNSNGGN